MFGSVLSLSHCHSLIRSLSSCAFPFQCAHGRPTIHPICQINKQDDQQTGSQNLNYIRENIKQIITRSKIQSTT